MSNLQSSADKAQMIELLNSIKIPVLGAGGGFAPIGIYAWSADYVTGAPEGWLRCEGGIYNIADYPELAIFYASQHGASNYWGGDGVTTFAVPDMRGEFIRGAGTNSHANQGSGGAVGEHQDGTEHCNIGMTTDDCSMYGAYSGNSEETADSLIGSHTTRYAANGATTPSQHPQFYTSRPTNTSGVFFVKATLSDANPDAYTVYSPNERQVGWWQEEIDGVLKQKPVYIQRFTGMSVSITNEASWQKIVDLQNGERLIELALYKNDGMIGNQQLYPRESEIDINANPVCISCHGLLSAVSPRVVNMVVAQYTKTTDQWQVV